MRDTIGNAFLNGVVDRVTHGLLRKENLYRRPWTRRAAWRLGWELANALMIGDAPTLRHRIQRAIAHAIRRVAPDSDLWWDVATFSPTRGHTCRCGHRSWTEREHLIGHKHEVT